MKLSKHKNSFASLGFIIGRDCVLSQWEPYENISHWEPYISLYWWRWQIHLKGRISTTCWLGRRWTIRREQAGWYF
jgi:hypothetical protein